MYTRYFALLLALGAAVPAHAQINGPRFQFNQPKAWFSLGAGYGQSWTVTNGAQTWDFGSAPQYVASLEKAVTSGASIGLAASTSRVPVRVTDGGGIQSTDANVSQVFATLHLANGGQLHTSFDFRAGTTVYSGLGSSTGGNGYDADFAFGLGYGVGYSFSPRFSLDIVQDATTSIHQKDAANPTAENSVRLHTTRLIGRFGLGG